MRIYFEPRDLWVGVYVGPDAVYICPLPTLVIKLSRRPKVGLGISCIGLVAPGQTCNAPVVFDFYCEEHMPPAIKTVRDAAVERNRRFGYVSPPGHNLVRCNRGGLHKYCPACNLRGCPCVGTGGIRRAD